MTIPDWYLFLNYKLIDTSSDVMALYNWVYIPFNLIESVIWFFWSVRVIVKYKKFNQSLVKWIYSLSYFLFGISDVIELSATTPLLLLFKGAIILSLIVCYKIINNNNIPLHENA